MEQQQSVRKTYKYKLKPTPEQERQLANVLWRCRALYNTALEQRILLYRQRSITLTRYQQEAELKACVPTCRSMPPSTATWCKMY